MGGSGDCFSGDEELGITDKAVKLEATTADYATKGERVKHEEEGAKS